MAINSTIWPVQYHPLADGVFTTTVGGQLSLGMPGGTATHDMFTGNLNYIGLFQNVISGVDFELITKVDSVLDAPAKFVAITCKQDDNNLLRFSVTCNFGTPNTQRIFCSKILAGTSTTITNTTLGSFFTAPFYMRVLKVGNNYKFYTKQNFEDAWTERTNYTDSTSTLAINQYGLAAGNNVFNAQTNNAPAWEALFDYFQVDPEIVNISSDASTTAPIGSGTLNANVLISGTATRNSAETVIHEGTLTVNPVVVIVVPPAPGTTPLPYGNKIVRESSKGLEFREQKAQYGDGKMQAAPDGINAAVDTWNVTWGALTLAEKLALETTLASNGTWGIYSWTPCNESSIKYFRVLNKSIKIQSEGLNGVYSMSVDLQQDFSVS